ncbi:hypothetical protein ABAZ39_11865 [Azospirillum argentinense]|uniref:Uncharacterized protein n=1 Tax=Azospirillum argentinense TaxID=2970906 RepID=A0A060DNH5_9PROT|nr:hypothetical protein [Azospirillum argentinense]AIB12673.1 hypothetical protein ABAZ39_11865 [Azospirillum argentinense]EZQ09864.1 hypothetical protein ABAZ39_13290 [Azospirillum argentinense]
MSMSFAKALAPLSQRIPRVVREHEVLRVTSWMPGDDPSAIARRAVAEVLKWAQRRAGGQLPAEAWDGRSFEFFSGGRNSSAVRLQAGTSDIWAIRADDPDKTVPERVWTTEVVLGLLPGEPAKFGARLLVSTPEVNLPIEPHTPGFVQQVAAKCRLMAGSQAILSTASEFIDGDDPEALIDHLLDPGRVLPTFVLTLPDVASADTPLIDPKSLARAVLGLAHVVVAHPATSWQLTERFGRRLSVFGGAARVYLPGFDDGADPYRHRLILMGELASAEGLARAMRWLRDTAAQESVRRTRLGSDVLTFAAIRSAALELYQTSLREGAASESKQLSAAQAQIIALQSQIEALRSEQDYYVTEYQKERERAEVAEAQAQASAYRIQTISDQLKSVGGNPDQGIVLPTQWSDLDDWCDRQFAGRLVLTPRARRGVRKPEFEAVQTAAYCLLWLATNGRDQRINGGGSLSNIPVMNGIQNAPCGADTYEFDWNGRRFSADWHIKNGGNVRDPVRCLRIYYCFDEQTQQIVVSDLPAHRRTGAT